jgi:uncharacterized membrane protein
MIAPIATLTYVILLLALAAWVLEWTLRPLLIAARTSATQRRFMLTDLVWLILQLQLAMALVARVFPASASTTSRVWGVSVLSAAVLAFWLASLQAVSQAGVLQPLRRAAVFMIVLPAAIAAFVGVPLLVAAWIVALLFPGPVAFGFGDLWLATVQLAAGALAVILIRRLAMWSVAESFAASGE